MKILWITPRWPEPAEDGARIATLQLLKALGQESDIELTLLGLLVDGENIAPIPGVNARETRIIRRPRGAQGVLASIAHLVKSPLEPIKFASFLGRNVRKPMFLSAFEKSWDWIVFDGLHAAIPFMGGGWPKGRLIYRAHNVEFSIWDRAGKAAGFPNRAIFQFQAALVKSFERALVRRCDLILPVSDEDARIFTRLEPQSAAKTTVIRIGQDFPPIVPQRSTSGAIFGFLGRLDWMPNKQGLAWFLSEVWPRAVAANPHIRLKIAGSGDAGWLERHSQMKGIELLGRLASLDSFYGSIEAALVPLFIGSGTRVKVIEASRFGVPCISTALGIEGCPLEAGVSYIRAESAAEWVDTLGKQADFAALGQAAFIRMQAIYDSRAIARKLVQELHEK